MFSIFKNSLFKILRFIILNKFIAYLFFQLYYSNQHLKILIRLSKNNWVCNFIILLNFLEVFYSCSIFAFSLVLYLFLNIKKVISAVNNPQLFSQILLFKSLVSELIIYYILDNKASYLRERHEKQLKLNITFHNYLLVLYQFISNAPKTTQPVIKEKVVSPISSSSWLFISRFNLFVDYHF